MKKILLLAFLLVPYLSHATILISVNDASTKKFPIAVPEFVNSKGSKSGMAKKMTDLIRLDLDVAGYFKVMDERSFISADEGDAINFNQWSSIGAHALVKGVIDEKGGKVVAELRLYDTSSQEMLIGKEYTVSKNDYPEAAHRFMDELLLTLTGIKGPFTSRIAAACGKTGARQIHVFSMDGVVHYTVGKLKSNNISPNWSPDGSTIVFTSFMKYYPEIYSINASGSGLKQLTNNKSTNLTPSFSPDGSTIVYASSRTGDTELYSMSHSGREGHAITNVLNIDVSPAWSPDGGQIVFASERAGNLHLFTMPSGGGSSTRLTYTGYQNDQPDWSPDGKRIVFTARDRGAFDLFMMNSDGSLIQRLTRDEGNNESPTWAPDSRYIGFSSGRSGGSGLYVMLDDGNGQTLIPESQGCINPDWGPRVE
ncbi:Tol-Pal system beta propeller repeat protein TolB [bacterium]|nr:Tol-Pal system beta propeller repeat protein TolB [bacterium]